MKLHNGFKLIELSNVERTPRLLVSKHGLRFNKPLSAMTDYAEYVRVYIDDEKKMLAVVPCKHTDNGATPFYRPKNKKCKTPSWTNKRFLKLVASIGGYDLEQSSVPLKPGLLDGGGIYFELSQVKE